MRPGSILAAVSGGCATLANLALQMTVEKWAAVVAIAAGCASFAVSIRTLFTPHTTTK